MLPLPLGRAQPWLPGVVLLPPGLREREEPQEPLAHAATALLLPPLLPLLLLPLALAWARAWAWA